MHQYCVFYLFGKLTSLLFIIPCKIPISTANPQFYAFTRHLIYPRLITTFTLPSLPKPAFNYYQV